MISGGFRTPTPKRSRAATVADSAKHFRPAQPPLPADLEARIAAFENISAVETTAADFDGASWFWMIVLGAALPLALLIAGWWA